MSTGTKGGPNDSRRRDARRAACEELADRLATDDGLRTARLLQAAAPPGEDVVSDPAPPPGLRPISIWQPRTEDDGELVFARPEPLPLGDHYAARRELPARKAEGTRRVAFFGESVAAGYLYAPHLTPAAVLEAQLRATGDYEVVDLARTNETLRGLLTTVESSLQLDPDVLVIFAGNNWNLLETPEVSPYFPSVASRQRYARALGDGGLAGPVQLARGELERKAEAWFAAVARVASEARVPVVLVIPEVNLADWESRQPAPWLPGDGTARWYELYDDAVRALAAEEWRAATRTAEAMHRLDGGASATVYRILARAAIGRGRRADARWACRAEVDAASYATLAFLDAPRATSQARELLRRAVARHGWGVVDLPEVFAEETPLPGRRHFLDYCHLTSEGMRTAVAAMASEVIGQVEGRDVSRSSLAGVAVEIPPSVEATARFGAALHGAHRLLTVGGERPILEHWCREALAADAGVGDAMLELAAARSAPCPAVLTAAQESNFRSPHRLLLQHGWRWEFLDAELVETICRVLEDAGRPAREEVEHLFAERQAIGPRGTELSRAPGLWEPLERFYPEAMDFADLDGRGTLRAPWPSSSFCMVHDGLSDVTLDLTARLPAIEGFEGKRTGEVRIAVDGLEVARVRLGETWTRQRMRVARESCRQGLNRVTLEWSPLPAAGDAALRSAVRRLETGLEADVHPVFGEVYSLRGASSRSSSSKSGTPSS